MRRRHNRRVTARKTRRGTWRATLYREGRAVARGTILGRIPQYVRWTVPYNMVEHGDVSDRTGRYVFLGYGGRIG